MFHICSPIGLQRDVYYGVYAAAVTALFVGWSWDTGQSAHGMCRRRWKLAVALTLIAAGAMVFIVTRQSKPVTGDLVWSIPTLATLNPIGAPTAHVGLHVSAVFHNYNSDLFLPPHH